VGGPFETTLAVTQLIFEGVLARDFVDLVRFREFGISRRVASRFEIRLVFGKEFPSLLP
jgi:hypothetical protein